MAVLCCFLAAALALSLLAARFLLGGVAQACALALPLACSLVLAMEGAGTSVNGRWLAIVGLVALSVAGGVWLPRGPTVKSPTSEGTSAESHKGWASARQSSSGWAGSALVLLLLLLIPQLHFQALELDPLAWKRQAVTQALAIGASPQGLFVPGVATTVSGYERFLAGLLPVGWDPLTLEWCLAPVLLLGSVGLLYSLVWPDSRRQGEVALAVFLAMMLPWGEGPPLVGVWGGATPLALSTLLAALVLARRLLDSSLLSRGPAAVATAAISWFVVVGALARFSTDLAWLLGLALILGWPFVIGAKNSKLPRAVRGGVGILLVLLLAVGIVWSRPVWNWDLAMPELSLTNLPFVLSPLSLLFLIQAGHRSGLFFWLLGVLAVLAPGVESQSPSLRPELAALGLSLSLALTLAGATRLSRWRTPATLSAIALSIALFWSVGQALGPSLARVRSGGGWPLMAPPALWRVQRVEMGVGVPDIDCARTLATQVLPGERLLTNLGSEVLGLGPDAVVAALSGVGLAGWRGEAEPVSPSDVQRDVLYLALQASGRPDLLWNSGVSWLLLRPSSDSLEKALRRSPHVRLGVSQGEGEARRDLWKVEPSPSLAIDRLPAQPPFRSRTVLVEKGKVSSLERPLAEAWIPEQPLHLQISALNEQSVPARLGWLRVEVLDEGGRQAWKPIHYLLGANPLPAGTGDLQEVVVIAPRVPGLYTVTGRLLSKEGAGEKLFEFSLSVEQGREGEGEVEHHGAPPAENL